MRVKGVRQNTAKTPLIQVSRCVFIPLTQKIRSRERQTNYPAEFDESSEEIVWTILLVPQKVEVRHYRHHLIRSRYLRKGILFNPHRGSPQSTGSDCSKGFHRIYIPYQFRCLYLMSDSFREQPSCRDKC